MVERLEIMVGGSGNAYAYTEAHDDGDYVFYSDYAALEARCAELARDAGELVVAQYATSAAEARIVDLEELIAAQHGDVVVRTAKLLYGKDDKIAKLETELATLRDRIEREPVVKARKGVVADTRDEMNDKFKPLEEAVRIRKSALASAPERVGAGKWHNGEPPKPWRSEWFIALTTYGDRVVLTALPEEWTYDYKTADDTYIKADKIKAWMQFPDSQFVEYASPPAPVDEIDIDATADKIARHIAAEVKSFGPTGRIHEPTYIAAKEGARLGLEAALASREAT